MNEHAREPWEVTDIPQPVRHSGLYVRTVHGSPGMDESRLIPASVVFGRCAAANARRIVAAVNATKGVPTAALEAGVLAEMTAAFEGMLLWCHSCGGTGTWAMAGQLANAAKSMPCPDCERARAVLARLEAKP